MMLQIDEYLVRISTNVRRPSQNLKNYRFACAAVLKFTWNPGHMIITDNYQNFKNKNTEYP